MRQYILLGLMVTATVSIFASVSLVDSGTRVAVDTLAVPDGADGAAMQLLATLDQTLRRVVSEGERIDWVAEPAGAERAISAHVTALDERVLGDNTEVRCTVELEIVDRSSHSRLTGGVVVRGDSDSRMIRQYALEGALRNALGSRQDGSAQAMR